MRSSRPYVQLDPAVIEQARQMDLLSYLQRYEPNNLKRVAGNVYCTKEHDSLKISNGKWYWWSRGIGGYSALDYLMKVRELGFVEAVQTLTGDMGDWKPPPPAVKKNEPKVLLLPEKNAELSAKYNIAVVEDNPYGELRFEGEHLPSVKSFDEAGNVLCTGSFSKIFCPGFRIGWMAGDKEIIRKYVLVKQGTDLQCNTIAQMTIAEYLKRYDIDKHIAKIIEVYRKRRDWIR